MTSGVARIWCQGHDDRSAEGASSEAPSGMGYGEGCPLPSRLEGLGERRELPQRGLGGAPAANAFSAYFRPQNAFGSKKNTIPLPKYKEKLVVRKTAILWNLGLLEKLQIPLWKKWWWQSPPLSKVVVTSHHRHIQSCAYGQYTSQWAGRCPQRCPHSEDPGPT